MSNPRNPADDAPDRISSDPRGRNSQSAAAAEETPEERQARINESFDRMDRKWRVIGFVNWSLTLIMLALWIKVLFFT
ncbi:MAG: hypothetical protein ISN29_09335 [Gammaproteobacteria bacterium AqS3]|nr:hypothetical protein [Gammaproteobacteria bacterium AqS3]